MEEIDLIMLKVAAVFCVLVAIYLVDQIRLRGKKRRRQELEDFASSSGFAFSAGEPSFVESISHFHFCALGSSPRVKNILRANRSGVEVEVADYAFDVPSGRTSKECIWTVIHLRFSSPLPHFIIRPKKFTDTFQSFANTGDVDFDSHPEFSSRYHLSGDDESAIRTFFTEDLLDFLEATFFQYVEVGPFGMFLLPKTDLLAIDEIESQVARTIAIGDRVLRLGLQS